MGQDVADILKEQDLLWLRTAEEATKLVGWKVPWAIAHEVLDDCGPEGLLAVGNLIARSDVKSAVVHIRSMTIKLYWFGLVLELRDYSDVEDFLSHVIGALRDYGLAHRQLRDACGQPSATRGGGPCRRSSTCSQA